MKKISIILAALATAFAVSCNKEAADIDTTDPSVPAGMKEVTISASIDDTATKTSYDAAGKFSWTKGDQISIMGTDKLFYTFTANETGATSTFTGVIPTDVSLRAEAFYPADQGIKREGDSYFYSIPEYKDLSASYSADIPMGACNGTDTYKFLHMTGAALFTFTNIPNGIETVEIAFSHSVKLSGVWGTYHSTTDNGETYWKIGAANASTDSEKNFIRKVPVVNNQAEVYLPYPSDGVIWSGLKVSVTGFDASDNEIVLLSERTTKNNIDAIPRANVIPCGELALPDYLPLSVDWDGPNVTTHTDEDVISELKVCVDENYLYVRFAATNTFECDYLHYYILGGEGDVTASWAWTSTGATVYHGEGSMSLSKLSLNYNGISLGTNVTTEGEKTYWHIAFPRSGHELTASSGHIYFSVMAYYNGEFAGAIPKRWGEMLKVTLP